MGLVNAVYTWPSVKALYFSVFSMNLAGIFALAITILWAIRFDKGFGDYLNLISPGDGHAWTAVIVFSIICCLPAYFLGIKCCWFYLKLDPTRSDLIDEEKVDNTADSQYANRLLFFHVLACLLSGFLLAILNATYLLLLSGFQQQKSRDGLAEAIEKYSSDIAVKIRVDAVQTELECCGDKSYEDWFRVPWLKISVEGPEDEEKGPRLEEQSVLEEQEEESSTPAVDVPFSCCSNQIPRPCVHHDILSPNAVYNYDPKYLTITTGGCRQKIISRAEVIRIFLAGYLALLSVYQIVLSLMSRLLQTAHSNELYIGPKKTSYHVRIFSRPDDFLPNQKRNVRRKRSRQRSSIPPNSDEEELNTRRNNRRSNTKVLTKIRTKILSVKSKSLPGIKRKNSRLEETIEEEKLLPKRVTKSELLAKKDRPSIYSLLQDDSSTVDLPASPPSPPPPPPFVVSLDVDSELDQVVVDQATPSRSSKIETNANYAFKRNIFANVNSGRRIKVLERFGKIIQRTDRATQHRESGGADLPGSASSSSSNRKNRKKLSSTDIYNRFRGTLQHTLARREAIRARRDSIYCPVENNLNIKRSNVLERFKLKNLPPSYSLLANLPNTTNVQKKSLKDIPPPPPLPPSPKSQETRALFRTQRQCSICNRPVRESPTKTSSSDESFVETSLHNRMNSTLALRRNSSQVVHCDYGKDSDYVPRPNRFHSVQRR